MRSVHISSAASRSGNPPTDKEFSVETCIIQADFTKLDIYEGIKEKLASLGIGVLVNNVGMAINISPFLDVPGGEMTYQDMLLVNNLSMIRMIHMVLLGQEKKGDSHQCFLSFCPLPFSFPGNLRGREGLFWTTFTKKPSEA
ncbi:unnamed protein product [Darwinula stevensoni]|uniref:Uncharacterized protein n=1 Tax=Darwinula stevensoni TaxID=69355 RepID=A0A7R8ZZM8_9CRUS|nr:unnamed protein product [Darwinula stevensoni]CAG0879139.1 unnamed protein product [Darwinula stevensoni]